MVLTGKCLENFTEWKKSKGIEFFNAKDYSLDIARAMHYAILIDFFDSVGIYITVNMVAGEFYFEIREIKKYGVVNYHKHIQKNESKNRNECLKVACEKSLEIFNSKP